MKSKTELSVIIVNYNTRQLTLDCIESVYKHGGVSDMEVIVVDNASSDGSREAIAKTYPAVRLFARSANDGFAKANNQGIRESRGEFVILLNSDTLVREHALRKLVDELKRHPEIGMIGPKLLNRDGTLQYSCAKRMTISSTFNEYWRGAVSSFYLPAELGSAREVDLLSGACIMLPRVVTDKVGPLDESYFMYSEDVDWCYRVRQAGYKIIYDPDAVVVHFGGGSSQKDIMQLNKELHYNRLRVFKKYNGPLAGLVVTAIVLPRLWLKKLFGRMA